MNKYIATKQHICMYMYVYHKCFKIELLYSKYRRHKKKLYTTHKNYNRSTQFKQDFIWIT